MRTCRVGSFHRFLPDPAGVFAPLPVRLGSKSLAPAGNRAKCFNEVPLLAEVAGVRQATFARRNALFTARASEISS